jgi:sulfonate transport system substrate-binding protein
LGRTPAQRAKTLADPKGEKIALDKGSTFIICLSARSSTGGIKYSEVEPIYLAPADARAAFEHGAVDAWVIWDPFRAAVEAAASAHTLADGRELAPNRQFYVAGRTFANKSPGVVDAIVVAISDIDRWAVNQQTAAAMQISAGIGVPASIVETALKRQAYGD